jgi:hypothetical protein
MPRITIVRARDRDFCAGEPYPLPCADGRPIRAVVCDTWPVSDSRMAVTVYLSDVDARRMLARPAA